MAAGHVIENALLAKRVWKMVLTGYFVSKIDYLSSNYYLKMYLTRETLDHINR